MTTRRSPSRPSWHRLRGELDEDGKPVRPTNEVAEAFGRIGRSADGEMIMDWLIETRLFRPPAAGVTDGALRDIAAEQRVALRFLRLLQGRQSNEQGSGKR